MNKLLTVGAVAALLMAGGQQVSQASTFCPPVALVGRIEATPGFSCDFFSPFGIATVSDFSFSSLLTNPDNYWLVFQGTLQGPPVGVDDAGFSVTLQNRVPGVRLPAGDVPDLFNYQMSISNISPSVLPPGMVSASLTLAAGPVSLPPPPVTGTVTATENFVGNVVGSNTLTAVAEGLFGHGTDAATLDGDTTFKVNNSLSTTPIPPLPSNPVLGDFVIDQFTGKITVTTPEPTSLSLFGVGLAGLALARRRRARPDARPT